MLLNFSRGREEGRGGGLLSCFSFEFLKFPVVSFARRTRCTYLSRKQMQIWLSCNVCLRSEKKEERNPSYKTGRSENRRRRRRVGLCELIPKVQTLPASYLGDRLNETPPCFGFPCIHNGRRDLITPDTEFTFGADAG